MLRRIAPAIGLFLLSPFVGEFLLGNVAIDALPIGLVMAPMYGGGAVLIRESARRAGKGWPTIFLLAIAYGVVEEGLSCQTLFNPSYFGFNLLREAYIPLLGMGVWWTLFVLTLHTIWSICVPIAIIESLVPDRATTPWLGRPGLAVATVLYVLGSALVFIGTYRQEQFMASPAQLAGVAVTALVLVAAAFALAFASGRTTTTRGRPAPGPWPVGAFSLLATSAFLVVRYVLADWPLVFAYLLLYGLAAVLVVRWSGRAGWGPAHRLALAGGALLTYAWHSFPETPVLGSAGTTDLAGNIVFSILAVLLLILAGRTVQRHEEEDLDGPQSLTHAPLALQIDRGRSAADVDLRAQGE
jgi:hypothetical protein